MVQRAHRMRDKVGSKTSSDKGVFNLLSKASTSIPNRLSIRKVKQCVLKSPALKLQREMLRLEWRLFISFNRLNIFKNSLTLAKLVKRGRRGTQRRDCPTGELGQTLDSWLTLTTTCSSIITAQVRLCWWVETLLFPILKFSLIIIGEQKPWQTHWWIAKTRAETTLNLRPDQ